MTKTKTVVLDKPLEDQIPSIEELTEVRDRLELQLQILQLHYQINQLQRALDGPISTEESDGESV